MTWRVVTGDPAWADIERLGSETKARLLEELAAWVDGGPPRVNRRVRLGVELFEDPTPSGLVVTYFVDPDVPYVAILRIAAPGQAW